MIAGELCLPSQRHQDRVAGQLVDISSIDFRSRAAGGVDLESGWFRVRHDRGGCAVPVSHVVHALVEVLAHVNTGVVHRVVTDRW